MYSITYFPPYSNGVSRYQYFNTKAEAERMADFYMELGTKAWVN